MINIRESEVFKFDEARDSDDSITNSSERDVLCMDT